MILAWKFRSGDAYEPLPNRAQEGSSDKTTNDIEIYPSRGSGISRILWILSVFVGLITGIAIGYAIATLSMPRTLDCGDGDSIQNVVPRIPLSNIRRVFTSHSPLSNTPSSGKDGEEITEPIWDSLIPNGLGYFKDDKLAPEVSIPTVFHQLHCLYLLRRAYYSGSDEPQEFDFGKDRATHVAHCFDYLQQGLTCSADTTVEVAVLANHDFLGSSFGRVCRDFGELKRFVELRRVFNATGFSAQGLDHGRIHLGSN